MEWIATAVHGTLALTVVLGVLFSSTPTQHITILIILLIILFCTRLQKGCFLTHWEAGNKLTLSQLGKAFYIQDPASEPSDAIFEEIVYANLVFLHLVRIAAYSLLPKAVF
jgi:hypothetical protein